MNTAGSFAQILVLSTASLGAQELGWTMGAQIHLVGGVNRDGRGTANDLYGRLGGGVELDIIRPLNAHHEFRASLAFSGIRVNTWEGADADGKTQEVREYWRSLRLSLEHAITLGSGRRGRPYLFYGAGIQDSWVARTHGSFLWVVGDHVMSWALDTTVKSDYRTYTSSLESTSGFLTAGLGWRFADRTTCLELRVVTGPHFAFAAEGLSTWGTSPLVKRQGTLILLSIGGRSRR
jgi:hypothetical protein